MSQILARREIDRFLATPTPQVLSISGKWGVGKTHAWDEAVKNLGGNAPLERYSYVSVFGLRSLEALKTAIFESTVRLGTTILEPTVQSFYENLSVYGPLDVLEQSGRRSVGKLVKLFGQAPYVGKAVELMAPSTALFIKNQIICIDDLERAGEGLSVMDVLGLVSSLKERKGCKVVLLLNEEGLGPQASVFREYLEKVVDQAISFLPTAEESATVAFAADDPLGRRVGARTTSLGITNIRVVRRIRRFLQHLETALASRHAGVTDRVVQSLALLGWCVFEPKFAPNLDRITQFNRFGGIFSDAKRTDEELRTDVLLSAYDFAEFEEIDEVVLNGLKTGAFDMHRFEDAIDDLQLRLMKEEDRQAIDSPWTVFKDSFEEDLDGFVGSLVESVERYAASMTPSEASVVIQTLRDLGRSREAGRLVTVYLDAQENRPREFFASVQNGHWSNADPEILAAFRRRIEVMPIDRDLGDVLLGIGRKSPSTPRDIEYLASVPVEEYHALLKRLRGDDLHTAILVAQRFEEVMSSDELHREITRRMTQALRLVGEEGPLNARRVRPYVQQAEAQSRHFAAQRAAQLRGARPSSDGVTDDGNQPG